MRICCKLAKIWDPKLANFYNEMYIWGHCHPLADISLQKLASLRSQILMSYRYVQQIYLT